MIVVFAPKRWRNNPLTLHVEEIVSMPLGGIRLHLAKDQNDHKRIKDSRMAYGKLDPEREILFMNHTQFKSQLRSIK